MATPNVNNLLPRLQRWYLSQCDGSWEHDHGIKIETLDNPGWWLTVNLEYTELEGRPFTPVESGVDRPEPNNDWFTCRVEGKHFNGWGGPEKLAELIAVFLNWAERKWPITRRTTAPARPSNGEGAGLAA